MRVRQVDKITNEIHIKKLIRTKHIRSQNIFQLFFFFLSN